MPNQTQKELDQFKSAPPTILVWEGQQEWQKPRYEVRYFHRRKVEVWSGYVPTKAVTGWVENVRIRLFVEKWKRDHGGALPTNDDILDWMIRDQNVLADKSREFELGSLAESIVKNGVRQPIVVTSDGTLLDGNRRYFASLMKLRSAEKSADKTVLAMVAHLPAYVLSPVCGKEDFDAVLIEENFVDDCRKPWPSFIKASKVYDAFRDLRGAGATKEAAKTELTAVFGEKRGQIDRWIRMMDYIQEFHDYHAAGDEETGRQPKDDFDISWTEQKYFEYFDELTKTQVVNTLGADPEFRDKVFERLYAGDFANFTLIRKLPAIASDRKARDKFMLLDGSEAVNEAVSWVTVTGAARKAMDVNDRITSFRRFLDSLTAQEIANLDPLVVRELQEIAQSVARMAAAAKRKE